jgi:DNA-binding transcriptional MerR regulator
MRDKMWTSEVARELEISSDHVRYLARRGVLHAELIGQVRVFRRGDVERLKQDRRTRHRDQSDPVAAAP